MDVTQPAQPVPPPPPPTASHRPRNGLGVAALVIGVASLVAGISFVLFPLALVGGLVGLTLGIIAMTRGKNRGATNTGQAIAGVVCCVLALAISIDLSVRVGTWPLATQVCSPGSTSASPRPPTGPMSPPASPASLTTSGPRERAANGDQSAGMPGTAVSGTPGCRQGLPEYRYPVRGVSGPSGVVHTLRSRHGKLLIEAPSQAREDYARMRQISPVY